MNQDLPFPRTTAQQVTHEHECNCGHQESEAIELDARAIPHAIRHAAIFGALDSIRSGFALDLIAPHNPLSLLAQAKDRYGDGFAVSYLEEGPQVWKVRFLRR